MDNDINDKVCPACGTSILGWEVPCPQCEEIPWNTPQGRRVIKKRRSAQEWADPMTWFKYFVLAAILLSLAGQAYFYFSTRNLQTMEYDEEHPDSGYAY